jgi:hypothetical protein
MLKIVLLLAAIGHILCGVCDCLLGYSPSGRLDLKGGLKDADRMREVFQDMPLKWPFASIMLFAVWSSGSILSLEEQMKHEMLCLNFKRKQ